MNWKFDFSPETSAIRCQPSVRALIASYNISCDYLHYLHMLGDDGSR